jgi:hypothetical protein
MNGVSSLVIIIAALLAVLTTAVSLGVLRNHSTLGNPVISICIGLLSFLGILYLPGDWRKMILIGYAALSLSLLLLMLLAGLTKVISWAGQRRFIRNKRLLPSRPRIEQCQNRVNSNTEQSTHANHKRTN